MKREVKNKKQVCESKVMPRGIVDKNLMLTALGIDQHLNEIRDGVQHTLSSLTHYKEGQLQPSIIYGPRSMDESFLGFGHEGQNSDPALRLENWRS